MSKTQTPLKLKNFSPKQRKAMLWWADKNCRDKYGCIAHGAVRSGKTFAMSLGFIFWAMSSFSGKNFAVCGKTIRSVRRNLVQPLLSALGGFDFITVKDRPSANCFDLSCMGRTNRFYLFGGKDESSAALIQGVTLAGLLVDETALMPRSFVEQATARCSVAGAKLWFNCNPESPFHWFKEEWIDKAEEKNLCVFHFELDDNPSLSQKVKDRYRSLYTGAFYRRFILGEWSAAEGLVYPMFSRELHCFSQLPEKFSRFVMSVDYGTVNPTSAGLWGKSGETWYRVAEYYYDSKKEGKLRTDEEHYAAVRELSHKAETLGGKVSAVVCDPSAASFMECIRRHGELHAVKAHNDVLSGIRRVSDALLSGSIKINESCADCLREFALYRWDEKSSGDCPIKENDHAMDDIRYFAGKFLTVRSKSTACAVSVGRDGRAN